MEIENVLSGQAAWEYWSGLAAGYSVASGKRLMAVTCGRRFGLRVLDSNGTERASPWIGRRKTTGAELTTAFTGLTDGLEYWTVREPLGDMPRDLALERVYLCSACYRQLVDGACPVCKPTEESAR